MKIVFTGDILRPGINQYMNVKWLFELAKDALPIFNGEMWFPGGMSSEIKSQEEWIQQFCADSHIFTDLFKEAFAEYPKDDLFIVAFELPSSVYNALIKDGYQVLNMCFHPIRFLPDLALGIMTNTHGVYGTKIPETETMKYASLMRTRYMDTKRFSPYNDVAVIFGQTPMDASLISRKDGHIYSIYEFEKNITAICNDHERVVYKPHPYADVTLELGNFLSQFTNLEIMETGGINSYEILSQPNVSVVAGISSSILTEAKYFGKDIMRFAPECSCGVINYGGILTSMYYWTMVTVGQHGGWDSRDIEIMRIQQQNNFLRKSKNEWWGYPRD